MILKKKRNRPKNVGGIRYVIMNSFIFVQPSLDNKRGIHIVVAYMFDIADKCELIR